MEYLVVVEVEREVDEVAMRNAGKRPINGIVAAGAMEEEMIDAHSFLYTAGLVNVA